MLTTTLSSVITGLRREVHDLLAQVDHRPHAIDERRDEREPRLERAVVAAEALEHRGARLGNDADRPRRDKERDDDDARRRRSVRPRWAPRLMLTSWHDERRRAPDLDHLDLLPGVDHLALVVGARGPDLAADLDRRRRPRGWRSARRTSACCPTSAAVPGAQRRPRAAVAHRDRAQQRQEERCAAAANATAATSPPAPSAASTAAIAAAHGERREVERVRVHLADREHRGDDQPQHP